MSVSVTPAGLVRLSVIIPAHNEAALASLMDELTRELEKRMPGDWEVLVVDDGSTDETSVSIEKPGVKLLRHAQRRGYGVAMKTGTKVATGGLIAWIDGDGTYPVEALVAALDALGDADQLIGARAVDFGRMRILRLAVKKSTARLASWLWATSIPDLNSGLRVFRRASLLAWIDELPEGFSCTTTATLAALNHHQRIKFLPIAYAVRGKKSHSKFHPLWDTLRLWRVIWRCWRRKGR